MSEVKKDMFAELRKVFFNHDPAAIGVKENNLEDEYDSEIELIIENLSAMDKNLDGVKELVSFVMDEFFDGMVAPSPELVEDISKVVL